MTYRTIDSPIGPFSMVIAAGVLRAAGFTTDIARLVGTVGAADAEVAAGTGPIAAAVERYFDGDLAALDPIPVAQAGGPFATTAWERMRQVPAGRRITYRQLAERSGRPDAIRAAGAACAGNRIALVVPCHRILRTGGGLGGYLWGLPVKQWLLAHEAPSAADLNEQLEIRFATEGAPA